jgi:O-antigen/teichoic acid export membrane protein
MSLLRKAILVNSTEFVCVLIGAAQTVVLTRVLGPAGIGQYFLLSSTLMLAAQLFCLGFPISFLYYSQHNQDKTAAYLMNCLWATLLLGVVGGITMTALVYYKADYFGQLPWFALLGIGLFMPIVLLSAVAQDSLLIKIEARRLGFMNLFVSTGAFSLVFILWALGVLTVGSAMLCFVSMAVFRIGIGWYWMRKRVDFSIKPAWSIIRGLGTMGVRQYWADVLVLLSPNLNIIIIKYLIKDFESVGYFSRGLQISMLVITSTRAIFPLLFSRWASLSGDKLINHVEKVLRFASVVGAIAIVAILLTGKWVIILMYGRAFLPAVKPMMILLPGAVPYFVGRILMRLLGSRGSPEWSAVALLEGAIITAVLSFLLTPVMGIKGAAIASTAGNIGLLATLMIVVARKYQLRFTQCLWMNKNDWQQVKVELKLGR